MIALLFSSTVLIWGTTWIAIAFQVGPVELLVSVFFRFALASILFLLALLVLGKLKIPERRHQIWLVAQSLCLFGLNFICFYKATSLIHSGLVSIIFSLATIFNAVNARIFFAERITKQVLFASFLGLLGLTLMFARDILTTDTEGTIQGIALACLGTLFFSLGNMISRRNSQEGIRASGGFSESFVGIPHLRKV